MEKNIGSTSGTSLIHNLTVNEEGGYVLVSVNPKIYPLDIIYSAAYALMDRAYIIIDGNPAEEVLVELRPKAKQGSIEQLGKELNNELINYAVYKSQASQNRGIREALLQRAFLTGVGNAENCGKEADFSEDPEGIAKPWSPKNKE